ncbi:MAG: hypothetical protein IIB36_09535 [Gemmatimonadetes bacterium]|nr:hypothetical protein [Gemmatimonadota bacterium]
MTAPASDAHEVLVRLSAVLASRRDEELESAMRVAAERGGTDAVEELILRSYLFLGRPGLPQTRVSVRARTGLER